MARDFGEYSPIVPLGTTWEETLELADENGDAIDLTGYDVVAQLHAEVPVRDPDTGEPATDPVLEITTAGFHVTPPDYSIEGFTVAAPLTGTITMSVPPDDLWTVSPANARAKFYWSVMLVNGAGYTIPVVSGRVAVLPAHTVVPS